MRYLRYLLLLMLLFSATALGQRTTFSLADALQQLSKAPQWRAANLTYTAAQHSYDAALAATGFNLTGGGSYSLSDTLDASGGASQGGSVSVSLSKTVLPWAPAYAQVESAKRSLEQAALKRQDTRNGLVLSVVNQYFAIELATHDETIAEQNSRLAQAQLKKARDQQRNGQLSQTGLLTAEQSISSAQASLQQAQSTLRMDRLTFWNTLGLTPSNASFTTSLPQAELPKTAVNDLVNEALTQRPDVREADLQLQEAREGLEATSAQRWIPQASLGVAVGQADSSGNQGATVSGNLDFQKGTASLSASYPVPPNSSATYHDRLQVSASVAIPILDPSGDASISSAQTSLDSATLALEAAKQSAALDVRQKYVAVQIAMAQLQSAQAARATSEQALSTTKAQHQAGLAVPLDVQAAQISKLQAERNVTNAQINLYLAVLNLENAVGTPDLTKAVAP